MVRQSLTTEKPGQPPGFIFEITLGSLLPARNSILFNPHCLLYYCKVKNGLAPLPMRATFSARRACATDKTPSEFTRAHRAAGPWKDQGCIIMPVKNKNVHCYIALSSDALANACCIPTRKIRDAIAAGILPVYQNSMHRRVLISDAEKWIRGWHKPARKNEVPKNV